MEFTAAKYASKAEIIKNKNAKRPTEMITPAERELNACPNKENILFCSRAFTKKKTIAKAATWHPSDVMLAKTFLMTGFANRHMASCQTQVAIPLYRLKN